MNIILSSFVLFASNDILEMSVSVEIYFSERDYFTVLQEFAALERDIYAVYYQI